MKVELDKVMDWYMISLDCQKVMQKLVMNRPEIIPLNSVLATKGVNDTKQLLETSINELNDLTIVSLISIFEQILIEHLKKIIRNQMNPCDPVTERISTYTIQQAERGRFYDIIGLFQPLVDIELIGMVKQVYNYRNWVAHGKPTNKTPTKIDPILAYERLAKFLRKINLY